MRCIVCNKEFTLGVGQRTCSYECYGEEKVVMDGIPTTGRCGSPDAYSDDVDEALCLSTGDPEGVSCEECPLWISFKSGKLLEDTPF